MVVLLALVEHGDVVLNVGGEDVDAARLEQAPRMPLETLVSFRFIKPPSALPLAEWLAVCELLGVPTGLMRHPDQREATITAIQQRVDEELSRIVRAQDQLQRGLVLWQAAVLEPHAQAQTQTDLARYKEFLERLRVFNTEGKLRNLRETEVGIRAQGAARERVRDVERLAETVAALLPLTSYLLQVETLLAPDHPLIEAIGHLRRLQLECLRKGAGEADPQLRQTLQRELEELRGDYIEAYAEWHEKARLSPQDEDRRQRLLASPRLRRLQALARLDLLPMDKLARSLENLRRQRACLQFVPSDLRSHPVCPHCSLRPQEVPGMSVSAVLDQVAGDLDRLEASWTQALLAELGQRQVEERLALLDGEKRVLVRTFLTQQSLPENVDDTFLAAINDALQNLEAIRVDGSDLFLALSADGAPCPPQEFRQRFERFLEEQLAGRNPRHVRISLDW